MANVADRGTSTNNPYPFRDFSELQDWTPGDVAAARVFARQPAPAPAQAVSPDRGVSGGPTQSQPWTFDFGFANPKTLPSQKFDQSVMTPAERKQARLVGSGANEVDLLNQDRQRRVNALFDAAPGPESVGTMTWAQYNALTPEQRNAVDFNTLLLHAVRKDRKMADTYDPSTEQQSAYDATLKQIFGDSDRGAKTYAPETVALLKRLGLKDKNADLNDFLSLKMAITDEDLQLLPETSGIEAISGQPPSGAGTTQAQGGLGPYGKQLQLKQSVASATGEMEAALAKGNQMLAGITGSVTQANNPTVKQLGGQPTELNALGYLQPKWITNPDGTREPADLNTYFQDAFDKIASRSNAKDADEILATMKKYRTPQEFAAFVNYANARTNNAARFGTALGRGDYSDAEKVRRLLGLGPATEGVPTPPTTADITSAEVRSNMPQYQPETPVPAPF